MNGPYIATPWVAVEKRGPKWVHFTIRKGCGDGGHWKYSLIAYAKVRADEPEEIEKARHDFAAIVAAVNSAHPPAKP